MSPDRIDRGSSRSRRGVWGHWVPLAVTLTVATVGVAAWAWSQRAKDGDDENEHEPDLDYDDADYGENPAYGTSRDLKGPEKPPRPDDESHGLAMGDEDGLNAGWGTRMSGALRRTPSPQQFFDSTGKNITAGVAAVSAAMGKALASIREEDKSPYNESNPWSEEADAKKDRGPAAGPSTSNAGGSGSGSSNKRRRTVAIVVSADSHTSGDEDDSFHEHASILSHISRHNDFSKIKLFVLIYTPGSKDTAMEASTSNLPPASLSSSFSNIGPDQVQTPGEEPKSPSTSNPTFDAVYSQAMGLVEKESMILPFSTPNGHVHILRHLQPEVIYLQESLAGDGGSIITSLQTWLRHDVILVVGADGGSGGLADSESEAEKSTKAEQWWQRPERVGRGRGVIVVDGMRVNDDWARRVQGKE